MKVKYKHQKKGSRIVHVEHEPETQEAAKEHNCMNWAACRTTRNGGASDKLVNA